MSTPSPNMGLVVSTVGVDSGLNWENNLNTSLLTIDGHNHTPGFGVPIPPSGLNINAPLPFNNQQATGLQATVFLPQASLATQYAVYSIGVDLYFNDGSGNVIQLTSGGSVNATTSGISSGTNTAAFVSSVLTVTSASTVPGNISCGSILLGNNSAGSKFLTLAPPNSMASNYGLVLPAIPAATSFLQIDTSGNITAGAAISAGLTTANLSATAGILGSQLANNTISDTQITALGITAASIANATLTTTQLSATAGIVATQNAAPVFHSQAMGGNATYSTGVNTAVTVTGVVVSATRPIMWSFTGNSAAGANLIIPAGWVITVNVQFGLTNVQQTRIDNSGGSDPMSLPMSSFNGFTTGVTGGTGHTALLGITINTAGSGVVSLTATTMAVMQI